MRCRDVAERWSAYIDGELDQVSASALRGHLRTCEACAALVEDGARMRDAMADLPPADPPQALWAAIERRIGEEEIADAGRPRLELWWRRMLAPVRQHALSAAVLTTAVAAGLLALGRGGNEDGQDAEPPAVAGAIGARRAAAADASAMPDGIAGILAAATAPSGHPDEAAAPAATAAAAEFYAARAGEVDRADRRYQTAIAELIAEVEAERSAWPAAVQRAFGERLDGFRAAVERAARAALSSDPADRDALYALYRQEIDFLQKAALGELAIAGLPRPRGGF